MITRDEFESLYINIQEWIQHSVTLRIHLINEDKPSDRAARLQFYKDKLAELKTLEENHE